MMRSLILTLCCALASTPLYADDWGNVKGQILFDGPPPAVQQLQVNKDQQHCLQSGPLVNENWVVNKDNKGVKNVVVWLTAANGAKPKIHPDLVAPPKE